MKRIEVMRYMDDKELAEFLLETFANLSIVSKEAQTVLVGVIVKWLNERVG
jgi:hypothetical protein